MTTSIRRLLARIPRRSIGDAGFLGTLAVIAGLTGSLAAILFVETISLLNGLLLMSPDARFRVASRPDLLLGATLLVPAAGGLLVGGLVSRFTDAGKPHSPTDVIKTVVAGLPFPGLRSAFVSTAGAAAALGCGASVGQFGPLVVLGAAVGRMVSRLRPGLASVASIIMACGVAAAISTAFNAPVAGLIFAHELVHRRYSLRAVAPTVIAAATGHFAGNAMLERPMLFQVASSGIEHAHEFMLFALLGAAAALIAVIYMRLIIGFGELSSRIAMPLPLKTGFAGLAVGITALWLPDVLGTGIRVLQFAAMEDAFGPGELMVLIAAKILLTALCLGFGFPGGTVGPALLIGMLFGTLWWMGVDTLALSGHSGIAPYAICGMMAVTGSAIGVPLAAVAIVFEITGSLELTMAAGVAVAAAYLVSNRLCGRSLFDVQIAGEGIDLADGAAQARLQAARVASFPARQVPFCRGDQTVAEFLDQHPPYAWREICVVARGGRLLGVVQRNDRKSTGCGPASSYASMPELTFDENTSLAQAQQPIEAFAGELVPVLSADRARLVSVVAKRDVADACRRTAGERRTRLPAFLRSRSGG